VLTTPTAIAYTDTADNDTFTNRTGTLAATDADNDILTYGLSGGTVANGSSSKQGTYGTLSVNTSTGAYTFVANDAAIEGIKANTSETFAVTVSDGKATANANLGVNLTGANDAPTGAVTISGTAKVGQTLTAGNSLADAEGVGAVSYQWFAAGVPISGATANNLALTTVQLGKVITVKASYTDGQQTAESKTSLETAAVGAGGTDPINNLTGKIYDWKNHKLINDVLVTITPQGAPVTDGPNTKPFEFRNVALTASGDLTAELWINPSASTAFGSFDLGASIDSRIVASFDQNTNATTGLPASWSLLFENSQTGSFRIAAFGLDAVARAVNLGTVTLDLPAGMSRTKVAITDSMIDETTFLPYESTVGTLTAITSNGAYAIEDLTPGNYSMTAVKAVGATETANTAISSADALAALKIAVGRNPNADPDGTGPLSAPAISPYQFIAADANEDGKVSSADALAILKMAVKRVDAPAREILFVNESHDFWNEAANAGKGGYTTTRSEVKWHEGDMLFTSPDTQNMNMVAVLKGDVNGSWVANSAPNAPVLDNDYFTELAARLNVPVSQWVL